MTRRARRRQRAQSANTPDGADAAGSGVRTGRSWRLRNWPLRTKLIAVLLVPVVTLLVLLGLRARADVVRAEEYEATSARLTVAGELNELITQLQRERAHSVRFVASGRDGDRQQLRAARGRVDAAAGEFGRALDAAESELSPAAADGFQRGKRMLERLSQLRYSVGHPGASTVEVRGSYGRLLAGLLNIGDRAIAVTEDSTLARDRLAASAVAKMKEQQSVIHGVLAAALREGSLSSRREHTLLAARAKLAAAEADFQTFASAQQQRMYSATVGGQAVKQRNSMLDAALAAAGAPALPADLKLDTWHDVATKTIKQLGGVQDSLHTALVSRADALTANARTALLVDLGLLLGVLLLGGALVIVVARSLLRQMRTLRHSALDVAEHRLPEAVRGILTDSEPWPDPGQWRRHLEPVPVFSREELGQVARAFDAVHGEAVRLAGEQAMLRENINSMFVNLSRRSQDLVERQLSVLDRMEAHEQDSETLGGLFELDHLATRMRRNSENLLVLSGQDLEYPVEGAVTAEEVVGAALSEVEHYQRVRVRLSAEPSVHAEVANDLVHVLSELLENATDYSPESQEVELVGSVTEDDEWLIEITDWGAGMAEVERRRANKRLADPPEVDVEVSRRMGLYVVARLAERHEIGVWLAEADNGGITASVRVPARLVSVAARTESAAEQTVITRLPVPARPADDEPAQAAAGLFEPTHGDVVDSPPEPEPVPEPAYQYPIDSAQEDGEQAEAEQQQTELEPPEQEPSEQEPPEQEQGEPELAADDVEQWPSEGAAALDWPTEDADRHPLEHELPTERLPAYRDVLDEWFQVSVDGKLSDLAFPVSHADSATAGELVWPTSVDSVWVEPRSDPIQHGAAEALPKRVPRADAVPAASETPAMDEAPTTEEDEAEQTLAEQTLGEQTLGEQDVPTQALPVAAEAVEVTDEVPTVDDMPTLGDVASGEYLPSISRAPDDVRDRMAGLQHGLAQGRQQSAP